MILMARKITDKYAFMFNLCLFSWCNAIKFDI